MWAGSESSTRETETKNTRRKTASRQEAREAQEDQEFRAKEKKPQAAGGPDRKTTITMQNFPNEGRLIPQPRGNLPTAVAAAVMAVAIAYAWMSTTPEEFFGHLAMASLTVMLGSLLHGLCLLAEELWHHKTTRYQGRVQLGMLAACGWGDQILLPAAFAVLVLFLTQSSLQQNKFSLQIFLVTVCYTLLKTLGILGPCKVEVSEICEGKKMNVAHGLAWSFYLNYMKLALPRLNDSITNFCATHPTSRNSWARGSRKLFVLIPLNANISEKLSDEDERIQFAGNLPSYEVDIAGIHGRVYKHSVYSIRDEDQKVYDCVVEYATPVLTLYKMSQESSAGFGESERTQQVLLFYKTLQEVLAKSLECRNRYKLILIIDENVKDPHILSKSILRHLKEQEKEEISLTRLPRQDLNRVWHNPAPMSREPTLMISLDPPRPLREPVENSHE